MDKVWTVWIDNEDINTMLVGIATTKEKGYKMADKLKEQYGGDYEYMVFEKNVDSLCIYDNRFNF